MLLIQNGRRMNKEEKIIKVTVFSKKRQERTFLGFPRYYKENKMKHSELQKQIENLGLIARDRMEYLCVLNEEGDYLATVSNKVMYKMEMISFDEYPELIESGKDEDVFSLLVEYARTPLDERYDPKKYNVIAYREKGGYPDNIVEDVYFYWRGNGGELLIAAEEGNKDRDQQWTLSQIEEYGLENCERIEVED